VRGRNCRLCTARQLLPPYRAGKGYLNRGMRTRPLRKSPRPIGLVPHGPTRRKLLAHRYLERPSLIRPALYLAQIASACESLYVASDYRRPITPYLLAMSIPAGAQLRAVQLRSSQSATLPPAAPRYTPTMANGADHRNLRRLFSLADSARGDWLQDSARDLHR
jgi:hypothetical protein